MEKPEKIEEIMINNINKSLGINKFAEEIYKAFPSIPKDKLLSLTRSFLENLKLLDNIYKVPKEIIEDIDSHIPHAD